MGFDVPGMLVGLMPEREGLSGYDMCYPGILM
jgi:hypothetical protein